MESLARTMQLMKESVQVLLSDTAILVFPLLSALVPSLVDGTLLFSLKNQLPMLLGPGGACTVGAQETYPMMFLAYAANYFVILFFNSALMACANVRLAGGHPSLGDGLRYAGVNAARILLWALIAATVGVLLHVLERSRILGWLVGRVFEVAWSLATFFIVPVIIFEGLDVFSAFKRSASLFKRQWGPEVASNFSCNLVYGLLCVAGVVVGIAIGRVFSPWIAVVTIALYLGTLYLVTVALQGIFAVALYRYAALGRGGLDSDLMQSAFAPRSV